MKYIHGSTVLGAKILLLTALFLENGAFGAVYTINVQDKYGVTQDGINKALAEARSHVGERPEDETVVFFNPGNFLIDQSGPAFEVSDINPSGGGRIVLRGGGMAETTLNFSGTDYTLSGRNTSHLSVTDMHLTRMNYTVTQGHVAEVGAGYVDLDIQDGFPTPLEIFDYWSDQGRFLREFTDNRTDPHLVVDPKNGGKVWPPTMNDQYAWRNTTLVSGRRWRMVLNEENEVANYSVGALIGVKSKDLGQEFFFDGCNDIEFDHVIWTQRSRGVLRGGTSNVKITNSIVDRSPPILGQTPCMAGPGGGPQVGQPDDPPVYNLAQLGQRGA